MLVRELLPVGIRGLVIAGLLAAIMSTIDSTLNAASAITLYDLVDLEERGLSARTQMLIGRGTTLLFMLLAILWAPVIQQFPGLFAYLQQVFSYAVPPVAVVFVGGMLWPRVSSSAALLTLIVGHLAGLTLLILDIMEIWPLHFTVNAGLLALFCALLLKLASPSAGFKTPAEGTTWRREMLAMDAPVGWLRDYRSGAVLVAGLTLLGLLLFW